MTQFETYFLLFTDVLTSNFAFNISSEVVFDAMQIFGEYDKKLMVIVSISAYMISICINYLLGRICYNILAPANSQEALRPSPIHHLRNSRFLPLIIILSAIPFFGKFIILFLGFCHSCHPREGGDLLKHFKVNSRLHDNDTQDRLRGNDIGNRHLGFCHGQFKRVFYIAILAKLIYYVLLILNIYNAFISHF